MIDKKVTSLELEKQKVYVLELISHATLNINDGEDRIIKPTPNSSNN